MRTLTVTPYFARRALASDLWNEISRNLHHDVTEHEKGFLLSMDLPGVKQENLKIEVVERTLMVKAERKREGQTQGTYEKTFTLPESVDTEKIEASHEDGVLELFIPKVEAAKPRTIQIQAGKKGFFGKLLGSSTTEVKETPETH